jgi:uncharacterized protein HemY
MHMMFKQNYLKITAVWALNCMLMLGAASPLQAAQAPEPDPLEIASLLLKDGYNSRAKEVLAKVDLEKPDVDLVRFYTLLGVLNHNRAYPEVSNIYINKAISMGQNNASIYLYMAKNYWSLKDYPHVVEYIDLAGDTAKSNEQMFMMKAEAYKHMGDIKQAWAVLDEGVAAFPENPGLLLQKFYYLIELGYYEYAVEFAETYLKQQQYSAKDYLAVAYALRSNGEYDKAAALLEEGVLRHPGDDKLVELLGQVYIDQQHYLAAATVFDRASIAYPRFAYKASALFLKAKQPIRALQLNRRISEQKDKFKLRLSIDIYLEDYESLVTKIDALKRYGLMEDDSILYAVGYAYYRNGEHDKARHYLKQINNSELFARASSIFKIIEKCQDEPLQCT